jgi:hypothetical protein
MRSRRIGVLLAGATLAVGGCSSHTPNAAAAGAPAHPATASMVMDSGMVMSTAEHRSGPSPAAAMICSDEVRGDLRTVLADRSVPEGSGVWHVDTYTCTYRLRVGTLVLSVHESPDVAGAEQHLRALRARLGGGESLLGLGEEAYAPADGTVILRKDNDVLLVDATALPAVFGSQDQHRADFAYEIASDILGCWTGDDGS